MGSRYFKKNMWRMNYINKLNQSSSYTVKIQNKILKRNQIHIKRKTSWRERDVYYKK